jgi:TorA maturation chaperone TorD
MAPISEIVAFDPAVSMARQTLYRFAAVALLDPRAGAWQRLAELRENRVLAEAAGLVRSLNEAIPEKLDLGERPLDDLDPQRVLDRLPTSPDALNAEYERVFGLLVSAACPPYETEYIHSKFAFQRSNALADVSGFYRAFGLTTSALLAERADHIVQELEFMAFLVGHERRAAQYNETTQERAEICRSAQARFLREHLAWWAPAFAKLLVRESRDGCYAAAGVFLAALIPADRALLQVPAPAQFAVPSTVEPPETCEGCALAS